jgi:polyisoprenoid-binding protein YceI
MPRLALPLLALALGLSACADVGDGPRATVEAADADTSAAAFAGTALPIDPAESRIEWLGAKVTRTHDGGFEDFHGTVHLDGETLTGVDLTIETASIWSDTERLTGHLKNEDFFEVDAYPEARFRADAFEPLAAADSVEWADATHRVSGVLTIRDRANRVTFPARVAVADGAVTAEADFIIDRQQWGLTYPGQPDDLIRDEVRIKLYVVAAGSPVASADDPS